LFSLRKKINFCDLAYEVAHMSYVGIHLDSCQAVPFNWADTWLVVVSGDGPNVCGHALLRAGVFYFHIAGPLNRPYFMTEQKYHQYSLEGRKRELFRRKIILPYPAGAQRKLEDLSINRWLWLGIPNNCVSYVEEILEAGGADDSIVSNCPVLWA
jgi:hypothetical protein